MLFSIILLLIIVQPSYQVVYSCDPTAVCGCSTNPASITRIVGGENAGIATWGWAVLIYRTDGTFCGGSIISSSWIITAAHCVNGHRPSQITIYAGSTFPKYGTQIIVPSQIIVHPYYIPATYENDIALLRLATPLIMSDPNISPICIPSVNSKTLSNGEWPPSGTAVSILYIFFKIHLQCLLIGCSHRMGCAL
jgi:secreted trypsin-like serine protease